ncbi:hypothetical protein [uncultured Psychroserpens sp.]|uniref:hypothetical protein n=1 Tax=uncultured Psychroserpens sp. TaxID=255436 RepID=UPI0026397BA7|nr:hypothetical protein [uncultured Psychroserpens sp.]
MKTKFKILGLLLFCFTISVSAQQKLSKVSKKIDVAKDVTIDLNTSYVQIEIDTWNKNTLEVEAYIEGEKLSKEELQEALKDWNLKVEGSGDRVKISSDGSHGSWEGLGDLEIGLESLKALEVLEVLGDLNLGDLPEMPVMPDLPEMPEIARVEILEMPEMPELPELPEGISNISFDSEAYKKDGEAYLEKWSKDYPAKDREKMKAWGREMAKVDFSKFEMRMEEWGEKFGKKFGEDYAKKMEKWGEEFEKKFDEKWAKEMEVWGEKYGKEMEKRGKELEKRMAKREKEMDKRREQLEERLEKRMEVREEAREKREEAHEKRREAHEKRRENLERRLELRSHKVKRTIKIKMPKGAKLNMNVRHGELKMSSVIYNLKADISHATLVANHIDGSETSISVSYSPVQVSTWSNGELNLNYVEDAHLNTVGILRLNSNSSDMYINDLTGNAIIDGSFGDLSISNITDTFTNLNVVLENSDATIKLPKSDYSVYFKGNRSRLNNEMTTQKTIENYPSGNRGGKQIVLNAKFSDIVLKQ